MPDTSPLTKTVVRVLTELAMDAAELGNPHDEDLQPMIDAATQAIGIALIRATKTTN